MPFFLIWPFAYETTGFISLHSAHCSFFSPLAVGCAAFLALTGSGAGAAAAGAAAAAATAALHAFLWPFQAACWHSRLQYQANLHNEHRLCASAFPQWAHGRNWLESAVGVGVGVVVFVVVVGLGLGLARLDFSVFFSAIIRRSSNSLSSSSKQRLEQAKM